MHESVTHRDVEETVKPKQDEAPKLPDNAALTLAFYSAARAEAVQRIVMRENIILAWMTLSSALVGLWVTNDKFRIGVAEVLPVVSLAFAMLAYRHTMVMGMLGTYLTRDLRDALRQRQESAPRHWDSSCALSEGGTRYLVLEILSYTLLQAGLPIAGLVYLLAWQHADLRSLAIWPGVVCTCVLVVGGIVELFSALRRKW